MTFFVLGFLCGMAVVLTGVYVAFCYLVAGPVVDNLDEYHG